MQTDQLQSVRAGRQPLPQKYKILISVVFGIFMVILDTTVVNVAFQTLRDEFGATLNDSQWIISIYVLSLGISTPLSAFLANRYGMKRIYLAGLSIFIVGSFLSGISPTLGFMIAARALQGFGGGIALPLAPPYYSAVSRQRNRALPSDILGLPPWSRQHWDPSWGDIWLIKTCGGSFFSSTLRSELSASSWVPSFYPTSLVTIGQPWIGWG